MSKGIWTKHLIAVDGNEAELRAFYFNAAQNRSCWFPPRDGMILEAVNISLASTTPDNQAKDASSSADVDASADEFISQLLGMSSTSIESSNNQAVAYHSSSSTSSSSIEYQQNSNHSSSISYNVDIQDRIQQAMTNNKEKFSTSSTSNKRFKSSSSNNHDTQEALSDYERQKSELEAREGSKGENAGKWLVR